MVGTRKSDLLIKGYRAGKLIEAIEGLLPQEETGGAYVG